MTAFRATYSDGTSAVRLRGDGLDLTADALVAHTSAGAPLAAWPYAEIELVEEVFAGRPVRVRRRGSESVLSVADAGFMAALDAAATSRRDPKREPGWRHQRSWRRVIPWMAGGVALAGLLWVAVAELMPAIVGFVPLSWEVEFGKRVHKQAIEMFSPADDRKAAACANPEGRAALHRLTGKLAAGAGAPVNFHVSIVESPIVNAFALPGGYIVFFSGILEKFESSDEFAAVVGHEMAHVILRHPLKSVTRSAGLSVLLGALTGGPGMGLLADSATRFLVQASYSRGAEAEADATALRARCRRPAV